MHRRDLASLTALVITALTVGVGCPEDPKPTPPATTGGAAKPPTTTPSATPTPAKTAEASPTGAGVITGVVNLTGKAPEMKVPTKRKDMDVCKAKEVKYNAVVVTDGKLQDVFVRIAVGAVKGKFEAPKTAAHIDQVDCMYTPRIQGVVAGSEIEIKNGDATLHNVHTYKGAETLFNQAQPAKSDPVKKSWEDGMIKFTCDVHPWMRGFVVVTDHPFFAVSGADGKYKIEKIPAGEYPVEAWHSQFGLKKGTAKVEDGKPAEVNFTFDAGDPEPAENKDELKGLW
jgi:plastocyanin